MLGKLKVKWEKPLGFKVKDHYYKKAKQEDFLARSIYKLKEIDQKYKVLKTGDQVLDLGYYPGSWIQLTAERVGKKGKVIGVDLQEINTKLSIKENVQLFQKDFLEVSSLEELGLSERVNVLLSDMAPQTTGVKLVDQLRSLELVEKVFSVLPLFLNEGGHLVAKVFESQDAQNFLKSQRKRFESFSFYRPKSTRSVSKEFFIIAKGFLSA